MENDLDDFENRLRTRLAPQPSAALRSRVLQAVGAELNAPRKYRHWPAMAAAAMILLNLSMVCATQDAFAFRRANGPQQIAAEIQAIRQIESQQWIFK